MSPVIPFTVSFDWCFPFRNAYCFQVVALCFSCASITDSQLSLLVRGRVHKIQVNFHIRYQGDSIKLL